MRIRYAATLALALSPLLAAPLGAQTLTTIRVAVGVTNPTSCTSPPGDYERLFITEQYTGRIRILRNNVLLATPFLDINPLVINSGNEQGLLGLAFHPDYQNNGYFFVSYNDNSGTSIVERYTVTANPEVADPNSGKLILRVTQPFSNHNGGNLAFGPDGYLYFGLGDGGSANDPGGRAQNGTTLLGKMLRLDIDTPAGVPYAIPATNPFVGNSNFLDEIWAYGLRNPWRFSFDRLTGDLYIGDVGQDAREEISFQSGTSTGGENYGWRCMEATRCTGLSGCTCNATTLTMPIHEYDHSLGFSITGGFVYRGCAMPGLHGTYFFADYGTARIWSFRYDGVNKTAFQERTAELRPSGFAINSITSFGEDALGEIYILDRGGEVFKIVESGPGGIDCNGNGRADVCDLQIGSSLDLNGDGIPDECQSLYADVAEISVATGGVQRLSLRASFLDRGRPYFVLGSITGTSPGTPIGSTLLPLNLDAYTRLMLELPNSPVFVNTLGSLDFFGLGSASLAIPAGFPELAGVRLYHAYLLTSPQFDFASNYITLDLVM